MFADPCGLIVRLRHHGERALGCHKTIAPGVIGFVWNVLPLRPPLVRRDAARFQKTRLALQGIEVISCARRGLVQNDPSDGVQTVATKEFLAGNSALILVEIVLHDVVRGHGQTVGFASFECSEHSLFRGHKIRLLGLVISAVFCDGVEHGGDAHPRTGQPTMSCRANFHFGLPTAASIPPFVSQRTASISCFVPGFSQWRPSTLSE